MLSNIFKIYIKVIKNKKFTYYFALCTLLFITFILSNPENEFVQGLRFLLDFQIMKLLILLKIIVISYYNLPLGMLNILAFSILYTINIESLTPETFDNIPNLVDKNKILKYNKNFKNHKKIAETKKKVKEVEDKSIEREEKEIKAPRKKALVASTDYFNEKRKNSNKEKDIEEVNLDETEDTIEKELKNRMSHEYRKLDEYNSSSSESSNSDSSDSSSDSSDSDKEIEEVSMNKAREHMLNSLRTSLKKRYLND
jgi:hypothetical protein